LIQTNPRTVYAKGYRLVKWLAVIIQRYVCSCIITSIIYLFIYLFIYLLLLLLLLFIIIIMEVLEGEINTEYDSVKWNGSILNAWGLRIPPRANGCAPNVKSNVEIGLDRETILLLLLFFILMKAILSWPFDA